MNSLDVALLRALRANAAHHSWSELADELATSREAICERVVELRLAGFTLEEHPTLGLRLAASPDRLIADDLFARLGDHATVREILVFAQTDSTNNRAAEAGRNRAASGLAIFAEEQTAGRGRFGRAWASAPHLGLWFSVLLRPSLPMAQWPRLTTWAAVKLARLVEDHTGCRAQIKWPNDLYLDGRKAGGILIETGVDVAQEPFAVLGIGVNVNHALADFPEELRERVTSLRLAHGSGIDRPALAAALLQQLDVDSGELTTAFASIVEQARQRSFLDGKWVAIRAGDAVLRGTAAGLDVEGQLLLRTADGALQCIGAGEATLAAGA